MKDISDKKLLIHVDVDSPSNLLEFYKLSNIDYSLDQLERFYEVSFERALAFFDRHGIKASFFVVGEELGKSATIRSVIRKAHDAGHEIENHTYSHPYGLCNMNENEMAVEISRCSDIIRQLTGRDPIGFRAPGYSVNTRLINVLAEQGFRYDSSGSWSMLNPALGILHKLLFKNGVKNTGFGNVSRKLKQQPYTPDKSDWIKESTTKGKIWELPLPSTGAKLLPFYHNFNLWAPSFLAANSSKHINRPCLIYLFHIVEFTDLNDDIPSALAVHPNLKKDLKTKLGIADKIINNLKSRYNLIKTEDYLKLLDKQASASGRNKNQLINT